MSTGEKAKSGSDLLDDSTPMLRHDKSLSSHGFSDYGGKEKDEHNDELEDEVGDLVDKRSKSRASK